MMVLPAGLLVRSKITHKHSVARLPHRRQPGRPHRPSRPGRHRRHRQLPNRLPALPCQENGPRSRSRPRLQPTQTQAAHAPSRSAGQADQCRRRRQRDDMNRSDLTKRRTRSGIPDHSRRAPRTDATPISTATHAKTTIVRPFHTTPITPTATRTPQTPHPTGGGTPLTSRFLAGLHRARLSLDAWGIFRRGAN